MKRVVRILFVCHGNICRSPMAEYIFKHLVRQAGLEDRFEIASAGVSEEEDGNDIYLPAKLQLREHGIPYGPHKAHEMTREELRLSAPTARTCPISQASDMSIMTM